MSTRMSDSAMLPVQVRDATGMRVQTTELPPDDLVNEAVARLVSGMGLPGTVDSRPVTYHARHDAEGRYLNPLERIGDAIRPGDSISLLPNVDAG